jgi:hypothetical protein
MKTSDLKNRILQGGLVVLIVVILVFLVATPGARAGSLKIQPEPTTHNLIKEMTHD